MCNVFVGINDVVYSLLYQDCPTQSQSMTDNVVCVLLLYFAVCLGLLSYIDTISKQMLSRCFS